MSEAPGKSTTLHVLEDAFFVAAAAAATVGAMEMLLASARSASDGYRAAVRHSDLSAITGLAQVAASVTKLLGDDTKSCKTVVYREQRPDGAPVVT